MDEQPKKMEGDVTNFIPKIPELVIKIITSPAEFYRNMPKGGGLVEPIIFLVILAVVTALIQVVLNFMGLGAAGVMAAGLSSIIIIPIFVIIFSFIGAAIAFVIWKIMGSQESYETAYRCCAYSMAVAPITAVLSIIPYLGNMAGTVLPMVLLAIASIEVHKIRTNLAWGVFGTIALLFVLMGLGAEKAARNMAGKSEMVIKQLEGIEEMSPEDAGKKLGEFMKGMQDGIGKDK